MLVACPHPLGRSMLLACPHPLGRSMLLACPHPLGRSMLSDALKRDTLKPLVLKQSEVTQRTTAVYCCCCVRVAALRRRKSGKNKTFDTLSKMGCKLRCHPTTFYCLTSVQKNGIYFFIVIHEKICVLFVIFCPQIGDAETELLSPPLHSPLPPLDVPVTRTFHASSTCFEHVSTNMAAKLGDIHSWDQSHRQTSAPQLRQKQIPGSRTGSRTTDYQMKRNSVKYADGFSSRCSKAMYISSPLYPPSSENIINYYRSLDKQRRLKTEWPRKHTGTILSDTISRCVSLDERISDHSENINSEGVNGEVLCWDLLSHRLQSLDGESIDRNKCTRRRKILPYSSSNSVAATESGIPLQSSELPLQSSEFNTEECSSSARIFSWRSTRLPNVSDPSELPSDASRVPGGVWAPSSCRSRSRCTNYMSSVARQYVLALLVLVLLPVATYALTGPNVCTKQET